MEFVECQAQGLRFQFPETEPFKPQNRDNMISRMATRCPRRLGAPAAVGTESAGPFQGSSALPADPGVSSFRTCSRRRQTHRLAHIDRTPNASHSTVWPQRVRETGHSDAGSAMKVIFFEMADQDKSATTKLAANSDVLCEKAALTRDNAGAFHDAEIISTALNSSFAVGLLDQLPI